MRILSGKEVLGQRQGGREVKQVGGGGDPRMSEFLPNGLRFFQQSSRSGQCEEEPLWGRDKFAGRDLKRVSRLLGGPMVTAGGSV